LRKRNIFSIPSLNSDVGFAVKSSLKVRTKAVKVQLKRSIGADSPNTFEVVIFGQNFGAYGEYDAVEPCFCFATQLYVLFLSVPL